MEFNFIAVLVAALIPTVIGFIWYNPKVFGGVWMEAAGMTEEKMKGGNMPLIFGISFVLSLFLSLQMNFITVHQFGVFQTLENIPDLSVEGTDVYNAYHYIMDNYGTNFRTFKHGALHGFLVSLFFVLPIMATNAMFERKSFKYIAVNVGYWTTSITIMGGIICAWM